MKENNKLAHLFKKPSPYLAAAILDGTTLQEVSQALKNGLDIVELRIDLYSKQNPDYVLKEVEKFQNIPTIATIRTKKEGGKWNGSEEERLHIFKNIIPKVNAIDIESSATQIIDEVISEAKANKTYVIVSYHNFNETPNITSLKNILDEAHKKGADIIKIATQINNQDDINNLTSLLINSDKKLIIIGMGDKGKITRLAFPAYGSLITFCCLTDSTAPGQLSLKDMATALKLFYPEKKQ